MVTFESSSYLAYEYCPYSTGTGGTYDVEQGSNDLLGRCDHTLDLINLALLVLEYNLLAC